MTEITKRESGILTPVVEVGRLIEVRKQIADMITQALIHGTDFAVIPGTPKPCLLQAGAEKVMQWFDVATKFEVVEKEVDHDRVVRWTKTKKVSSGIIREAGESLGLYRYTVKCVLYRRATGDVVGEAIGSASTLESRYIDRPRDCENTIIQMAQKRAMVRAVRNVFGLSDRFTQDLEGGEEEETRPQAAEPAQEQKAEPKPQDDALTTSGLVEAVEKKVGRRTDGKEYTRAAITIGGERFYTFDKVLIEKAEAAKESGKALIISYTSGRFGRDIRTARIEGESEATQAEIPF